MHSRVEHLAWPDEWHRQGRAVTVLETSGAVFLGLLAAGMVVIGVTVGGVAHFLAGAVMGGLAVVLVAMARSSRRRMRPPEAHVEEARVDADGHVAPGIRFPIKPVSRVGAVVTLLLGAGMGVLALAALGMIVAAFIPAIPLEPSWSVLPGVVILGGIGAFLVYGGIVGLRSRKEGLGIHLTAEYLVVSLGRERLVLPWPAVEAVRALGHHIGLRGPRRVMNWILICVPRDHADGQVLRQNAMVERVRSASPNAGSGRVAAAVPHTRLDTDPVLAYHALRFYLANPDRRGELADGTSLSRLREGRVAG